MIATQGRKAKQFATPEERIAFDRERLRNALKKYKAANPDKVQWWQKKSRIKGQRVDKL